MNILTDSLGYEGVGKGVRWVGDGRLGIGLMGSGVDDGKINVGDEENMHI